jgi:hypothetical protein
VHLLGFSRRVLFLVDRANLGRQTLKEFRRRSFGARSTGLGVVELQLYEVAVRVPHVEGLPRPSGAYDVPGGAFDLHASRFELFGQCLQTSILDHEGEVIVTPCGAGLEGGIRPQMQDKLGSYPQRDEGMFSALILVEAERFETMDVAVEA